MENCKPKILLAWSLGRFSPSIKMFNEDITYIIDDKEYKIKYNKRRFAVFVRNRKCVICGRVAHTLAICYDGQGVYYDMLHEDRHGNRFWWTIDHIKPICLGGTNDLDNLQGMCSPCNTKKGNKYNGCDSDTKYTDYASWNEMFIC